MDWGELLLWAMFIPQAFIWWDMAKAEWPSLFRRVSRH